MSKLRVELVEDINMEDKEDSLVNFMMGIIAAPVVLAWVGLSIFLIVSAFNNPEITTDIESYKSVLLIIGSPALVIIYKVLELWTTQQNSQIEQVRKQTYKSFNNRQDDDVEEQIKE